MRTRRRFLRDSAVLLGAASATGTKAQGRGDTNGFDVVIVGAGSAGCLLADRLSADGSRRVLLIEAGGPATAPVLHDPGKWTTLLGTSVDWDYATAPEPGLDGRSIRWPRGRLYGGSSAIHAMAYVRGHQLGYARWADAAGPSWGYHALLPVFRALEDNSRGASDYLGAGGPMAVSDTTDPHAGHLAFLDAARELGFQSDPQWDFNGRRQENGAGFYQKTIRGGRRESAATAFLAPALERPNLSVWPNTFVHRIVIARGRAVGVECVRDGQPTAAHAASGVVVSAGVVESPKLLMLSGIGPAAALGAHGIAVVADAPGVGANLHDHPRVSLRWGGRSPLPPSSVSAGLVTWSDRSPALLPPDVQFYVGRGIDQPDPFITLTVALSHPRSRGSIALRSADPAAPPVIQANYFQDGRDLDAMVAGVRLAQRLADARAYAGLRGAPIDPPAGTRADASLRAFIRRAADTIFHPAGTCRMGRDAASVVDPELRVRGVDRLWVADASVMPEAPNSQIFAAVLAIAARAAASI